MVYAFILAEHALSAVMHVVNVTHLVNVDAC